MGGKQGVVCVHEDVPGVRGWYAGEEIVAVADHHARLVEGKLGVEEYLWSLRHAGDGFCGKVAEAAYGPGVLEGGNGADAVGGVGEEIEDKLGVCLYGVDSGLEEESGPLVLLPE